jgi:CheY-like chemotaxis protein
MTAPQQPLFGLDVLVVEDDPDAREVLSFMFRRLGARIREVGSASDAMAEYLQLRPHVVVSDISMPDEDGISLITKIRAHERRIGGSSVAAIALSGFTEPELRTQALAAGFQVLLAKPIEPEALRDAVLSVLPGRS